MVRQAVQGCSFRLATPRRGPGMGYSPFNAARGSSGPGSSQTPHYAMPEYAHARSDSRSRLAASTSEENGTERRARPTCTDPFKMSPTETILEPTTILETLRVYDIHETGSEETAEARSDEPQHGLEQLPPPTQIDPNWPSDWRRMPPYRAASRTHRVSDRTAGQNAMESTFVVTMFHGVWILGAVNYVWRITAGRWNDRVMRYKVGGEW